MKKRLIIIIINLLVAFWVSFFFIRNSDLRNKVELINYLFLTLTVFLPTLILVIPSFFSKAPNHLNEIYVVPTLVTILFVILNSIVVTVLSITNKKSVEVSLIVEGVFWTIYGMIMLLVVIGTTHMKNVNKK